MALLYHQRELAKLADSHNKPANKLPFTFLNTSGKAFIHKRAVQLPANELYERLTTAKSRHNSRIRSERELKKFESELPIPVEHGNYSPEMNGFIKTLRSDYLPHLPKNPMEQPPSFYGEDMNFWKRKFATSKRERAAMKDRLAKRLLHDNTCRGASTTYHKQRKPSRMSNETFCVVDIDYKGNTNHIAEAINKRKNGPPAHGKSQLDFEVSLRSYSIYDDGASTASKKPWKINQTANNDLTSQSINIPEDEESMILKSNVYTSGYKEKNLNNIMHIIKSKDKYPTTINWECGLRNQGRPITSPLRDMKQGYISKHLKL